MNNSKNKLKICRVCGLYSEEYFPWGEDGESPTYDFCFCCGVEFGYGDATLEGVKSWRKKWIESGAKWHDPEYKTENWSLEEQLKNIPEEYR
jgi:hypothetical protein